MDDNKNKVLRLRDVVLYTVSAMLFMDQIALASSLGPSSLFWWLYVLVLLFLPMAMMTSELGTAFPPTAASTTGCVAPSASAGGPGVMDVLGQQRTVDAFGLHLVRQHARRLLFPRAEPLGQDRHRHRPGAAHRGVQRGRAAPGQMAAEPRALLKLLAVLALGVGGLHHGWNHGFANDFSLDSIVRPRRARWPRWE